MSHTALYRRYRPRQFQEVQGQTAITTSLQSAVIQQKLSHCYLFFGDHGTGKTSTAKIFAQALNCLKPSNGEPCQQCQMCQLMNTDSLLDFIEIDGASHNGVNEIRDIKKQVATLPVMNRYKVYLIDEAHMLTNAAFNALLKTIEEPPSYIVFIFATTNRFKMPLTVLSRCQQYHFRKLPTSTIAEQLATIATQEAIQLSQASCELLASLADGSLRDAISLLDRCLLTTSNQPITVAQITTWCDVLAREQLNHLWDLMHRNERIDLINELNRYHHQVNMTWLVNTLLRDAKEMFEYHLTNDTTYLRHVPLNLATQINTNTTTTDWHDIMNLILTTIKQSHQTDNLFLSVYLLMSQLTWHWSKLSPAKKSQPKQPAPGKPNQTATKLSPTVKPNKQPAPGKPNEAPKPSKVTATLPEPPASKLPSKLKQNHNYYADINVAELCAEYDTTLDDSKIDQFVIAPAFVYNLLIHFDRTARERYITAHQQFWTITTNENLAAIRTLWFLFEAKILSASKEGILLSCKTTKIANYANHQLAKPAVQAALRQLWGSVYVICLAKATIPKWKQAFHNLSGAASQAHQQYELTSYDYLHREKRQHFLTKMHFFANYKVQ